MNLNAQGKVQRWLSSILGLLPYSYIKIQLIAPQGIINQKMMQWRVHFLSTFIGLYVTEKKKKKRETPFDSSGMWSSFQRSSGFAGQCHSFLCPRGESPSEAFLDPLQKCRSCTCTEVGELPLPLVLSSTRWRKENHTFLFAASSHSRFSHLLACHAARLTQKTVLLSKQRKSASKILGITTVKSVQHFSKTAS